MISFLRITTAVIATACALYGCDQPPVTLSSTAATTQPHRGAVANAASGVTSYAIANDVPPPNGPLDVNRYGTCDDAGDAFVVHVDAWKPHFHFTLTCGMRVAYQGPTF